MSPTSNIEVADTEAEGGHVEKIAERVRALLAKAESTEFPAEAEALTAKAQELMARYAIDQVYVHRHATPGAVTDRCIPIPRPYQSAKVLVLATVAEANHCRCVWTPYAGTGTVFGAERDVDAVELLFTSLLVQATRAMIAGGRGYGAGDTRAYRQAFLVAYASRIGERLEAITSRIVAEADAHRGGDLLPVLAARRDDVDHAVAAKYPRLGTGRVRWWHPSGAAAGRAAADRAQLGHEPELRTG